MQSQTSDHLIRQFIKRISLTWQLIFIVDLILYGIAFVHHFQTRMPPRPLSYLHTLDWVSFIIALTLALLIFRYKRVYFRLSYFEKFMDAVAAANPAADEKALIRAVLNELRSRFTTVWLMGSGLIILGVIYYWWTLVSYNMHVYFIVGLYSLFLNYPRRIFFDDLPFIAKSILKEQSSDAQPES